MTGFILLAALMAAIAIASILWPLLRKPATAEAAPSWRTAIVVAVLLPLSALLLYQQWSNWNWEASPAVADEQGQFRDMVSKLETRLQTNGEDLTGWMMLGRSYLVLKEYPKATSAYARAYALTRGENVDAALGYAEAQVLSNPENLKGAAGDIFEQVVTREPNNAKALWYGGLTALERGNPAAARDRWKGLLALNPPPEIAARLQEQVTALEQQLGATPGSSAATPGPAPAAGARRIRLQLSLAPALQGRIAPETTLFIAVRDPAQPGPPLAVQRRRAGDLPLSLELSDADAMLPGRDLSHAAGAVTVVARVSRSGTPTPSSGDLYGELSHGFGSDAPVQLVIDQVVP